MRAMDVFFSAVSLMLPIAVGFGLARKLWPRDAWSVGVQVALSLGLGSGVCSLLLLVWLLMMGRPGRELLVVEAAVAAVLCWRTIAWRRPRWSRAARRPSAFVLWGASLLVAIAVVVSVIRVAKTPYGDWDAWETWNTRARMIYLGGDHWRDAFSPLLADSGSDYPLLVPLSNTGIWLGVGDAATLGPAVLALAFIFSTLLLLGSAVSFFRDMSHGLLAAAVLAATPSLAVVGTMQYADVEVAFFFLSTLVSLKFYDRTDNFRFLVLAGLSAGLAAWTKNEGLIFFAAVFIARLAFARKRAKLWWYCLGASLPLAAVLYHKAFLAAGPNRMMADQRLGSLLPRLGDISRYRVIGIAILHQLVHFGDSFGKWPVSILIALLLWAITLGAKPGVRRSVIPGAIAVLITLAGYLTVYAVSPLNLEFHLLTSLDRLLLQLWPATLLVCFLVVRTQTESSSSVSAWRARLTTAATATLLILGLWASVSNLRAWQREGSWVAMEIDAYERRLSSIRTLLPRHGTIGYVSVFPQSKEPVWTQYLLAPLVLVASSDPELVILDRGVSDSPDERKDGRYSVEEHDGMKLYDFGTGIYLEDRRGMHQEHPQQPAPQSR